MNNNNQSLIVTILVATLLISGSMIYMGYQMRGNNTSLSDIEAGIEAYAAKQQAEANKPNYVKGDYIDDDPVMGKANAPVTIIEWSDFECPFCSRFFKDTLPTIKEKYVDTGKVKFVYRDFPLSFHDPAATREALAANCAKEQGDDEIYFAYHDMIFERTKANGQGIEIDELYNMAKELNLDENQFRECLDSEKYKDEIIKDITDGKKAGVNGTPAFLINGQLVSGAQPLNVFEQIIEEALK